MSWQRAQKEARRWIDSLNLRAARGRLIDLREPAAALPFTGQFRQMVLRAAARLLKTRGANALLPLTENDDGRKLPAANSEPSITQ